MNRAPPDDDTTPVVRPHVSIADDIPSPLAKPQKRRKRLQTLAAHRALEISNGELESSMRSGEEHLEKMVKKLVTYKPDLVIVGKTVARIAQEQLREEKISLVINVKESLMRRIARSTGADILPSPDHLINPRLGTCQSWRVEYVRVSTSHAATSVASRRAWPGVGCWG